MTDQESSNGGDDTGEDLYHDLPPFQYDDRLAELEKTDKVYKEEISSLLEKVNIQDEKIIILEEENNALKFNIASLLKTAKSELQRKDNMIIELRRENSNITFRRNKKVMKDQSTNTEIDVFNEIVNDVKRTIEMKLREGLNENARNSVSSVSSGSKTSEYGDSCRFQEKKKVEFKEKSNSRERDERLDYNKSRKPERGRKDDRSRRRDSNLDNISSRDSKVQITSRSRYDKFHERRGRSREKDSNRGKDKYQRSKSWYRPSDRHEPEFKKFDSKRRSRNDKLDRRRESEKIKSVSPEVLKNKEKTEVLDSKRRSRNDKLDRKRESEKIKSVSPEVLKNKEKTEVLDSKRRSQNDKLDRKRESEKIKSVSPEVLKNKEKTEVLDSKRRSQNDKLDRKRESEKIKSFSPEVLKNKEKTEVKNKISASEYLKRKNNLNNEKNKKHVFDTTSPLEALYCDQEKVAGITSKKNLGKVASNDFEDSEDYGEDWALSFKNERAEKPKPKTLYSRRMEEKLLGISAGEPKNESPLDSNRSKDENCVVSNKKVEKKKEQTTGNVENTTKSPTANLKFTPKKVPEEEKEPGELSDDEDDDDETELKLKKQSPIVPILNNSEPIPTPNVKACVSDTSSEMEILEPPKTPDIRESPNNSSIKNEISCRNRLSGAVVEKETEKVLESSLEQLKAKDNNEKAKDEESQKVFEDLFNNPKDQLATEYSPFKNNYKLIKISPLKPETHIRRESLRNGMRPPSEVLAKKKLSAGGEEEKVEAEEGSDSREKERRVSVETKEEAEEIPDLGKKEGSVDGENKEEAEETTPNSGKKEESVSVKTKVEAAETPNSRKRERSVRKKVEKKEPKENSKESRSSQKPDKKEISTRSRRKTAEKVQETTEKPKIVKDNKRKREESVEKVEKVKKEPKKRKKSESSSKEPATKKPKNESNASSEGAAEETDPEKKQDITEFEFFKPASQVACLETPNKLEEFKNLIINEKIGKSVFSPLPCNKTNDFMTPRRMLRNDLMLTDSEEESPVKVQVNNVNEVAESDESEESSYDSSDSESYGSDFIDLL